MTIQRILLLAAALLLAACAGEEATRTRGAVADPGSATDAGTPGEGPLPLRAAGVTRNVQVKAAILPLGGVPYDGFSLPLPSPDGQLVATQTGIAPDWPAVLGEPGAEPTELNRIVVYALGPGSTDPARLHEVEAPALLGRSSTTDGFLVEQVRADGGRRIGLADWTSGRIEWLVDDGAINAFAALGPDGRLAWSRRPATAGTDDGFELRVRGADGSSFAIPTDGGDWVMPTWSGRGDGLFALRRSGERLELVHGTATTTETWRRSLRAITVSERGSVYLAYQVANGQPSILLGTPPHERIVFFHPRLNQAAVRRPRSGGERDARPLGHGALTAVVDGDRDFALVPTASDLWSRPLVDDVEGVALLRGLLIPRAVDRDDWPYLLLAPGEDRVGLTAMRLVE